MWPSQSDLLKHHMIYNITVIDVPNRYSKSFVYFAFIPKFASIAIHFFVVIRWRYIMMPLLIEYIIVYLIYVQVELTCFHCLLHLLYKIVSPSMEMYLCNNILLDLQTGEFDRYRGLTSMPSTAASAFPLDTFSQPTQEA